MFINSAVQSGLRVADNKGIAPDSETYDGHAYGTFRSQKVSDGDEIPTVRVYRKRYAMLILYSVCAALNGFQWIQFPIIASIVSCYYHVSIATINWTSILFMVMYLPFMFPVAWMMSVKGLRMTLILAGAGNALTSCIQCISLDPSKFYVAIIAQTVASIAQVFSASMPSFVAAVWFGPRGVSLACAVGVFSNQLGIAFGFLVSPLLVPSDCQDKESVKLGLWRLALGQVVCNVLAYVAIVLFFEDKPAAPPSLAEAMKPKRSTSTTKSMWHMLKNCHFSMLMIANGLISSVYYAVSTMLNQMVVKTFPKRELEAGWMGMESVLTGMLGSLLCGYILDRTHMFRQSGIVIYILSLLTMVAYTIVAPVQILWLHFLMFGLIGFFMIGYMPLAFEYAAEMTYPEPEGTSATILVAVVSGLGIFITMVGSWLLETFGCLFSNVFFCVLLAIGCLISVFIKGEHKRSMQNSAVARQLEAAA